MNDTGWWVICAVAVLITFVAGLHADQMAHEIELAKYNCEVGK